MTTKVSKQHVVSVRKGTPSKTWKENLRRACLDRVRQISRSRKTTGETKNNSVQPARLLVEREMVQQGISLLSPCTTSRHNVSFEEDNTAMVLLAEEHGDDDDDSAPQANHYISEQELFELLEEVEAEIEKAETLRIDEVLQYEERGQLDLEERISEFQTWSEESLKIRESYETVLCPICCESNLQQDTSTGRIVCPNVMDGSCSFDLPNQHKILLETLKEFLRVVLEEHGSYCNERLSFYVARGVNGADSMIQDQDGLLIASCYSCGTNKTIA